MNTCQPFQRLARRNFGCCLLPVLTCCLWPAHIQTNFAQEPEADPTVTLVEPEMAAKSVDSTSKFSSEVTSESGLPLLSTSASQTGDDSPQELSVEPGTQPLLPADRPAWIGAVPDFTSDIHRIHVGSSITRNPDEADSLLDVPLVEALRDYVDMQVLDRSGAALDLQRKLTADYVRKNLIDDPSGYVVELNTAGIPMFQKWVTISVTPEQRREIVKWDREATQLKRLLPIGMGMLGLMGFVSLSHLVLKGRKQPATSAMVHDSVSYAEAATTKTPSRSRGLRFVSWIAVLGVVGILPIVLLGSLISKHNVREATPSHVVRSNVHVIREGRVSPAHSSRIITGKHTIVHIESD